MNPPFTIDQFLNVFRTYNEAIGPAPLVAYGLGVLAVGLAIKPRAASDGFISGSLALFWVWMGALYHLVFFSAINQAAYVFGPLFIVQGGLLMLAGVVQDRLVFRARADAYGVVGGLFILYALVLYPLLGHTYPYAPLFGVAPCPTVIFTFGLLLWTQGRVPGWLLMIPFFWSLVGFTAALWLGVLEDIGLLVAGVVGTGMLLHRNQHPDRVPVTA